MQVNTADIGSLLQLGGTVGALTFLVMALLKGWVVPAAMYRQMRSDRDDWKEIAMTNARSAERGIDVAQRGIAVRRRSSTVDRGR